MFKPHPVVEKMMEDEVGRRVTEAMDIAGAYAQAYADCSQPDATPRDLEYLGQEVERTKQALEAHMRLLVMGTMVVEMEGATDEQA